MIAFLILLTLVLFAPRLLFGALGWAFAAAVGLAKLAVGWGFVLLVVWLCQ